MTWRFCVWWYPDDILASMENLNKNILIGAGVVALILVAGWVFMGSPSHPLPIAEGDTIASWDFTGTYKDGGELEKKANDEIAREQSLLGGDQSGKGDDPTDYIIYVSVANQYELLGNGKAAYDNLGRALKIDSTKTGLAWRNLGALMEKLGAFNTARTAFSRAVEAQTGVMEYHIARLQFLMRHFADDTTAIESAFIEAQKTFGDAPEILQIKAEWKEKIGRYDEAIAALQKMEQLVGSRNEGVAREIARLRGL